MPKTPTKSTPSKSKKPRVAAATPKKSASRSAKPKKVAAKSRVPAAGMTSTSSVSAADRQRMIQDAAYHLAEKDGFQPGREQHYWFQAEQQIDQLIQGQTVVATGNQQFDSIDTAETGESSGGSAHGDIH